MESASDADDVENLQHPASTADNLDDLARVEVEEAGYQQVADIYEQPIPASAAPEPDAGPVPGAGSAANDRAPPLYQTEPGAEGYDFGQAYGSLHDRNQFYRADSNWRGNIYMREYLSELDAQAAELLTNLGGSTDGIAGDSYGHRTANIYATMQTMLDEAAQAGRLDDVVEIRTAMDRLEALVNTTIIDVAAQSAEFSGAAIGSQRVPIDAGIDTDKLKSWLDEQLLRVQDMFAAGRAARRSGRQGEGRAGCELGGGLLGPVDQGARRGHQPPRRLERADRPHPRGKGRSLPRAVRRRHRRRRTVWLYLHPPPHGGPGTARSLHQAPGTTRRDALRSGVLQ